MSLAANTYKETGWAERLKLFLFQHSGWVKALDRGPVWMVLSAALFALVGVFVKTGSQYFSTAELVFYRSGLSLVFVTLVASFTGIALRTHILGAHIWRSVAGTIAMILSFYAVTHLPLAMAAALNYTSPLFFATLSIFFLRHRGSAISYFAILSGFVGVALLLHPTFAGINWHAGLLGLLSGLMAAIAYIGVNRLGQLHEPESRTVFYFSLVATLVSGVWMVTTRLHSIDWHNAGLLLGLGLAATGAQLTLTRAYKTGKGIAITCLAYTNVVIASGFGMWLWGDKHTLSEYLAMALIIASGIVTSLPRERK